MNLINQDPFKLKVLNNYAIVEFIKDDINISKIILIKQNNSTKLRSIYVGKVIKRPEFMYGDKNLKSKIDLSCLKCNETIVAYNPMSIQCKLEWNNKIYNIIRVEDIYCIIDNYKEV